MIVPKLDDKGRSRNGGSQGDHQQEHGMDSVANSHQGVHSVSQIQTDDGSNVISNPASTPNWGTSAIASLREAEQVLPLDSDDEPVGVNFHPRISHWVQTLPVDVGREVPQDGGWTSPSESLRFVLERRMSSVSLEPVAGAALLELLSLLRTRREVRRDAVGRQWESRGYPSAGGTHCIDLLVYANEVMGWARGWYRWSDSALAAEPVIFQRGSELLLAAQKSVRQERPFPAGVFAIADPALLLQRYPSGASLLWRDAGALVGIAQLVATDLHLVSTISGACLSVNTSAPVISDDLEGLAYAVGGLILGGRVDE